MKATELLRRYQTGERNFQGENLQGQSFEDKDLSGSNFRGADIRGANFSRAKLIGVDFSRTQGGLQRSWTVFRVIVSCLLAWIAGQFTHFVRPSISIIFQTQNLDNITIGWTSVALLILFCVVFLRQGITTAAFTLTITGVIFGSILSVLGAGADIDDFTGGFTAVGLVAVISAVLVAVHVVVAVFVVVVVAAAVAVAVATARAIAGAIAAATTTAVAAATTTAVAADGAFATAIDIVANPATASASIAAAIAAATAIITILFSSYIGWHTLAGDPKHKLIRTAAMTLAAAGGTNFHGADLTNASFQQASLKSTDLRQATLIRTCWSQTQNIDRACLGESYLQNPKVLALVQTGEGEGQEYNNLNLCGINLQGAYLQGASFQASDLSEANLQNADLAKANLVQTQLDRTDLAGACLTGATIEDWGITTETKFHGVHCEYVYMRWVKTGAPDTNPRRKPDNYNEIFTDKDFADLIRPIVDTLDRKPN